MVRTLALLLAWAAAGTAAPTDGEQESRREVFRQAWQAVQDDPASFVLPAELADYPLRDYLRAEALEHRLGTEAAPTDAEVRAFLAATAGEPVAWRLERAWLLDLAARERWTDFLAALPRQLRSDELACLRIRARLALELHEGLEELVRRQWLQPTDQPDDCDGGFAWLQRRGALTPELIGRRLLLAIEAGRSRMARYLMGRLPESYRERYRWRYELRFRPARALERWAAGPDPAVEAGWLTEAFWALARRRPEEALARYPALMDSGQLDDTAKRQLHQSLALGLAYDRDPRALDWMRKPLPNQPAHDLGAWKVRAALWAGDWSLARRWLLDLPPAELATPRWQYWLGRAEQQLGNPEQARRHLADAAAGREFFAFLAAERIGRPPAMGHRALPEDPDTRRRLLAEPGTVRARELHAVGLPERALTEWETVSADWDDRARLAAATLLGDWGWHELSIALMAQLDRWDDLERRFPLPHRALFEQAAADTGIELELLMALSRAESLFNPRARSSAGAHGLMQLLRSTARETAARHELPRPDRDALYDPSVNIALGARYLAELHQRLAAWPLAIAAYNAGPHRIPRWLPAEPIDADIWIENVPYNETRRYIRRVLMYRSVFGWRLRGEAPRLQPLLAPIAAGE